MKSILTLVAAMAIATSSCFAGAACDKCCKDNGKTCASCCKDKGKKCGTDCCKKESLTETKATTK